MSVAISEVDIHFSRAQSLDRLNYVRCKFLPEIEVRHSFTAFFDDLKKARKAAGVTLSTKKKER